MNEAQLRSFMERIKREDGLTDNGIELICQVRFGKSYAKLTRLELIELVKQIDGSKNRRMEPR